MPVHLSSTFLSKASQINSSARSSFSVLLPFLTEVTYNPEFAFSALFIQHVLKTFCVQALIQVKRMCRMYEQESLLLWCLRYSQWRQAN